MGCRYGISSTGFAKHTVIYTVLANPTHKLVYTTDHWQQWAPCRYCSYVNCTCMVLLIPNTTSVRQAGSPWWQAVLNAMHMQLLLLVDIAHFISE